MLLRVTKYPTSDRMEKLIMRKAIINQLLLFLPESPDANLISINQAKTRKGNPSSIEKSENRDICAGEINGDRKVFIIT